MTVTVLGVMVVEVIANGRDGKRLPAQVQLVELTLTEKKMREDRAALRPDPTMVVGPDFEAAAQDAFGWWDRPVDVSWVLKSPNPPGQTDPPEQTDLPPLRGPSLGGAFAVGLTLLYYRGGNGTAELNSRLANSVVHVDPLSFAVSATVTTPGLRGEAIKLGPVGQLDSKKTAGRALVVSDRQADAPSTCILAGTVEEALNKIFDLQANNIFQL